MCSEPGLCGSSVRSSSLMAAGQKRPMTFLSMAETVLRSAKLPLSPAEIWEEATTSGLTAQPGSTGKTPIDSLGARPYVEVRDPSSRFGKVGERPARFFLRGSMAEGAPVAPPTETEASPGVRIAERRLHPFLVTFAHDEELE